MFSNVSNFVEGVDTAFALIIGVSLLFFVAIIAALIYIVIRFSKKRNPVAQQFTHSTKLEIIWTGIPLILVLLMFYYGYLGFADMRRKPDNTIKIDAIGRMWEWEFVYPNGKHYKDTLVIPKDSAIELNLISKDVNHSFYIPAFRIKEDMVPQFKNFMWFIPYQEGDYDIFCTEYCGLNHSSMLGVARVVSTEKYLAFLDSIPAESEAPAGLQIIKDLGCTACHSFDGSVGAGPSFKGLYGSERKLTDGSTVTADADYIKNSVYNPTSQVVEGFGPIMQSYKDKVSKEQLDEIVKYFQSMEQ